MATQETGGRRWGASGPPLPSAWSSLNIHFMARAGREAEPAARPGCGREGSRARRRGLRLSRTLSQQNQPRLGRRDFRLRGSLATTGTRLFRLEDGGAGLQRTVRSHVGETSLRSGPFGGAAAMPAVTLQIPTS